MRSEPKTNMVVVLKHEELNKDAQKMVITKVNPDNTVDCAWVTKDGVPYKTQWNQDCLEKYNPKRFADEK